MLTTTFEAHPGATRPLSLRATPPRRGLRRCSPRDRKGFDDMRDLVFFLPLQPQAKSPPAEGWLAPPAGVGLGPGTAAHAVPTSFNTLLRHRITRSILGLALFGMSGNSFSARDLILTTSAA